MVAEQPLSVPRNIKEDPEELLRYIITLTERINQLEQTIAALKQS